MCPYRLTKEHKGFCMKTPIYFSKKCHNCDLSRLSDLLTVDETWIYKFEPHRHANNKQWLYKDQARPVMVREQKALGKVSYALLLNSDWPIV